MLSLEGGIVQDRDGDGEREDGEEVDYDGKPTCSPS